MRTLFQTAWDVTNNLAVSYQQEITHCCALWVTRSLCYNTTMVWLLTTHSFLTVFLITWPYLGTQQSLWRKSKLTLKQSTVLESFIPVCHPETEMDLWSTPRGMRREPEPGGEHSFHFLHVSSVLTCDTKGMTVIQPQERRLHTWEFNTKAFFTHSLSSI